MKINNISIKPPRLYIKETVGANLSVAVTANGSNCTKGKLLHVVDFSKLSTKQLLYHSERFYYFAGQLVKLARLKS